MIKPFIKYPGGKIKEFPIVERNKPEMIERYFEPFVGGASIYLNMNIRKSFINDKSKDLVDLYRYVKEQNNSFFEYLSEIDYLWKEIEKETSYCFKNIIDERFFYEYYNKSLILKRKKISDFEGQGYPISREDKEEAVLTAKKTALYMIIRDLYNSKDTKDYIHTACFYFLREYSYSSMFRFGKNGNFNVPYGGRSYNMKYMSAKIEQMRAKETISRFEETEIYDDDFEIFLNRFDLNEGDFIFLDPPYDSDFSTYDNNLFDKNEQMRLAMLLKKIKAKWLMIIKKTQFIYDLYKDFNVREYDKNYLVSFKNRNEKEAKHLLITNY